MGNVSATLIRPAAHPAAAAPSNAQTIGSSLYGFLTGKGFSPHQAQLGEAGFLGNFKIESGFSPTAYNSAEHATGIAQWEGGRGASGALGAYASAHHGSPTSLATQIGYLEHELSGPYSGTVNALRTVTTPQQAAHTVASTFEGNNPVSDPARESAAAALYQQITSGHPLTGASNPGGTATAGGAGGGHAGGLGSSVPGFHIPNPLSGGSLSNPLTYLLPGGELASIPGIGSSITGAASSIGGDVAQGALSAITTIAHPIFTFVVNAGLVVFGLVAIIVALVVFAHVDESPTTILASRTGNSEGSDAGDGAEAEEAAAAA